MTEFKDVIVLKFGGSSLSSPVRIREVARLAVRHLEETRHLVIVVSAMGKSTNQLLELAIEVSPRAQNESHRRELDMLLSAGERISMSLLSMALSDLGVDAVSFTGSQSGIITSRDHGQAAIEEIKPIRIEENLKKGRVCIVAGFQGVNENKDVTTLGRGGSDTTAVALGAHFGAKMVYIYTDVDGVFDKDPKLSTDAAVIRELTAERALEMARNGAKVLHPACVEWAIKGSVPVRVLSSFFEGADPPVLSTIQMQGTLISTVRT